MGKNTEKKTELICYGNNNLAKFAVVEKEFECYDNGCI